MNIDLTPVFQAVISLVAALIAYKVIPWIKARTSNEQQEMLIMVTRTMVFAAEQLYKTGKVRDRLQYVAEQLGKQGYLVDINLIEAMVQELRLEQQQKPPELPAE